MYCRDLIYLTMQYRPMCSMHSMAHWKCNHSLITCFSVLFHVSLYLSHTQTHTHTGMHGCGAFQLPGFIVLFYLAALAHLALTLPAPYKWLYSASIELTVHVLNTLHTRYISIIDWARCLCQESQRHEGPGNRLIWAGRRKSVVELAECLLVFWLLVLGRALLLEIKWIRKW